LMEPAASGNIGYYGDVPAAFESRNDEFFIVPVYHIFGSEELSALCPGIAEKAPQPYVGLNSDALTALGVSEGDGVQVAIRTRRLTLPARRIASLPMGVAALPIGLRGLEGVDLPAWGRIYRSG
jgi:NADH-quinone oxidoreductase subunit G